MSTMLALYQASTSTTEQDLTIFKVGQIPCPTLPPPQSHVLLKVYAAALNPVDIKRAAHPLDKTFPVTLGYDVAGVIESVAPDVTTLQPGDRVFGDIVADTLGPKLTGSIAEFAVCRADLLARVPEGVSFISAAAVPLVGITAIQVLRHARIRPGANVFVNAGAGGVGLHLMQIAKKMFSATAIATTASTVKTHIVERYGADRVVDYRSQDAGEILAGWADVVVDTLGEYDMVRKIRKDGGTVVSIFGTSQPDIHKYLMQPCANDINTVASLLAEGSLVPVVDCVYELPEALKGVERQASGRACGKLVIKVREE